MLCLCSPPPYRPDSSASMIEIPSALRDTQHPQHRHAPRSATVGNIDSVGVSDTDTIAMTTPVEEDDITASQVVTVNKAYVIGLHELFCLLLHFFQRKSLMLLL